MTKTDQGFSPDNSVDIDVIRLELYTKEVVELKNNFQELNIYCSMFTDGITATLIFNDNANITNNGPILGGEKVFVRWKSPMWPDWEEMMFKVDRVGGRVPTTFQSAVVMLHLVSQTFYDALAYNPSRGFKTQYSTVALKLWESAKFEKELKSDPSFGINTIATAENKSILSTIDWLATRSKTADGLPFVFFEDIDYFNYASWSRILKQTESHVTLVHQPQMTEETPEKAFRNILSIQFDGNRDGGEFSLLGLGGCNETIYDPLKKTTYLNSRSFEKFSKQVPRLDKGVLTSKVEKTEMRRFCLAQYDGSQDTAFNRAALNYALKNNSINIVTYGDNRMRLGSIAKVNLMSIQLQDNPELIPEKFFNGNMLVTDLKHTIRPGEYRLYWKLTKESYSEEVTVR